MTAPPACELLPAPPAGRTYGTARTVRLGDTDPSGRLRLDAVARYLQDVASDDAHDAQLPDALAWVVRRTMIEVRYPAVIGERIRLLTFCTGFGRSWAERRTSITGEHGAAIEAVSLWVQIDTGRGRPAPLGAAFFEIYGEAAAQRRVSSRLGLPKSPPDDADRSDWRFRRADLDQLGHVNNAAHWTVIEEILQRRRIEAVGRWQLEYLAPTEADIALTLAVGDDGLWLTSGSGTVTAAAWSPTPAS